MSLRSTRSHALGTPLFLMLLVIGLLAGPMGGIDAAPAPLPSAAAGWSITPSASPFDPAAIPWTGVSCSSDTSCFAVGMRGTFESPYPGVAVERWDGATWSIVDAPNPAGATLSAVSCPSATSCFAVGSTDSGAGTLVEQWNGTAWSVVASPAPSGATSMSLLGVSCPSASSCFAVGGYSTATAGGTLVEQWDGSAWSVVASPNPGGPGGLQAVSCVDPANCVAVGASAAGPLAEQWDGAAWSIVPTPNPKIAPGETMFGVETNLDGVSCTSTTSCVAVGFTPSDPLVEQWDGTRWSIRSSPDTKGPHGDNVIELRSVSCSSAASCNAVGNSIEISLSNDLADRAPTASVAEHWNGTSWSAVAGPKGVPASRQGPAQLGQLSAVSCPTASSCAAVGNSALAEHYDGRSWSIAPVAATSSFSELVSISCRSATNCFAVGDAGFTGGIEGLIEHWDGATWSVVPSPQPAGTDLFAQLYGVSCASPTSCIAVGGYSRSTTFSNSTGGALIERWNGARWSMVASPVPAHSTGVIFKGVSCPSASSCNAVGTYGIVVSNNLVTLPLAEHWNGIRWSIAPVPKRSDGQLNAVSCWSNTFCTAVGYSAAGRPAAERWNGASWVVTAVPSPKGTTYSTLDGVSCPTPASCTAVGSWFSTSGTATALVERWNGTTWSIVPAPGPAGAVGTTLTAVSCHGPAKCTAVGGHDGLVGYPFTGDHPLVEESNGASWSVVPAAEPAGSHGTALAGVSCPTAAGCIAAGAHLVAAGIDSSGLFTLTEQGR